MTSEGLGNMTPQRALPSEGQTGAARRPAEVFHVSAFIQDEMDARGWGLEELEQASALPLGRLAAIMDGKHLTVACTRALGKAFGTSADLWEHLDAAWWASLEAYSRGGLRAGVVCPRCGQPEYFACAPSCFDADGKHWRVAAWQPGKEETPMADWKTTAAEPREGFEDRDDWREKTRALTAQLRQSEAMREAQISNVKAFTDETIRLAERNLRLEKELSRSFARSGTPPSHPLHRLHQSGERTDEGAEAVAVRGESLAESGVLVRSRSSARRPGNDRRHVHGGSRCTAQGR
jgi:plasmid maintenance system antidote protein VapI